MDREVEKLAGLTRRRVAVAGAVAAGAIAGRKHAKNTQRKAWAASGSTKGPKRAKVIKPSKPINFAPAPLTGMQPKPTAPKLTPPPKPSRSGTSSKRTRPSAPPKPSRHGTSTATSSRVGRAVRSSQATRRKVAGMRKNDAELAQLIAKAKGKHSARRRALMAAGLAAAIGGGGGGIWANNKHPRGSGGRFKPTPGSGSGSGSGRLPGPAALHAGPKRPLALNAGARKVTVRPVSPSREVGVSVRTKPPKKRVNNDKEAAANEQADNEEYYRRRAAAARMKQKYPNAGITAKHPSKDDSKALHERDMPPSAQRARVKGGAIVPADGRIAPRTVTPKPKVQGPTHSDHNPGDDFEYTVHENGKNVTRKGGLGPAQAHGSWHDDVDAVRNAASAKAGKGGSNTLRSSSRGADLKAVPRKKVRVTWHGGDTWVVHGDEAKPYKTSFGHAKDAKHAREIFDSADFATDRVRWR